MLRTRAWFLIWFILGGLGYIACAYSAYENLGKTCV
ncbi:hypothetical protein PSPO01_13429 [Paraphaeosphaeria sporulosa]